MTRHLLVAACVLALPTAALASTSMSKKHMHMSRHSHHKMVSSPNRLMRNEGFQRRDQM